MSRTIAIMLVIAAIVGLGVYKTSRHKAVAPTIEAPSMYFCREGVLKVTYGTDTVTLRLLDGRTITLPQTLSGSGVRYESGEMTFVTKGDYGTFSENSTTSYTDCILGIDESNTFTDGSHRFSFRHTNDMTISGGSAVYDTNWRNNVPTLGQRMVVGTISRDVQPLTNFAGAIFTVGTSADPDAVRDCLIPTNGEVAKGVATINAVAYQKFILGDAAAGNYYDTTSYRTLRDEQCYAVEYTIHSTNIGNYDPSQGIKEYNTHAVVSVLELAAQSFTFLPQ